MDQRRWHAFYDEGVPASFPFADRTLTEALDRAAAKRPEHTAIWFLNRRMAYRELKDRVDRLATAVSARSGEDALKAIESDVPELVLLDIVLAGMDGFEVLKQIRRESGVPILMLTARGDEADRIVEAVRDRVPPDRELVVGTGREPRRRPSRPRCARLRPGPRRFSCARPWRSEAR